MLPSSPSSLALPGFVELRDRRGARAQKSYVRGRRSGGLGFEVLPGVASLRSAVHDGLPELRFLRARKAWGCCGDGSASDPRWCEFAEGCSVEIAPGEVHLESLAGALPFAVGTKHCAACALAFFPVRRVESAPAPAGSAAAAPASCDNSSRAAAASAA